MKLQSEPGVMAKQIGKWACHKLECFADYLKTYAERPGNAERYYLELNVGSGQCLCRGTDCLIDDSPLRALAAGFSRCIFVSGDSGSARSLSGLTGAHQVSKVDIMVGNCNQASFTRLLIDRVPRSASSFAFIDPPGYRWLRWKTLERLATHGRDWRGHRMDMLIVFPLEMALLRNLTRPECQASITRLYGNHDWLAIREARLEGKITPDQVRQRLVALFTAGLKRLGYRHVDDFHPASFSRQPFYHVIWASDRSGGAKLLSETWGRARYLPCELLYHDGDGSRE